MKGKSKGFTLVELAVAVAIVLIVVVIAIPKGTSSRESAKTLGDKENNKALDVFLTINENVIIPPGSTDTQIAQSTIDRLQRERDFNNLTNIHSNLKGVDPVIQTTDEVPSLINNAIEVYSVKPSETTIKALPKGTVAVYRCKIIGIEAVVSTPVTEPIVYNPETDFDFDGLSTILGLTAQGLAKPIINIPPTIGSNTVANIGFNAFDSNTTLKTLTMTDSVTGIADSAFWGCTSLNSITLSNNLTTIIDSAFYNCSSLPSITLPNSLKTIGLGVFYGCTSLTSITVPNSVTSMGAQVFQNCTNLTSAVVSNKVTAIGSKAFSGCSSLTSITVPGSVTSIAVDSFTGCGALVVKTPLGSYARTSGRFPVGTTFIQ